MSHIWKSPCWNFRWGLTVTVVFPVVETNARMVVWILKYLYLHFFLSECISEKYYWKLGSLQIRFGRSVTLLLTGF